MLVRPANINPGYSLLTVSDTPGPVHGFAVTCSVRSDLPDQNNLGRGFFASRAYSSDGVSSEENHGWLHFNNGPLVASKAIDFQSYDGSALVPGYAVALMLGCSIGIGLQDALGSLESDTTCTIYLVTADFDPAAITWNNEPSIAGYPVASVITAQGPATFNMGITIPLDTPIYGLTARMQPWPLQIPGVDNLSNYIFTPYLLVLNV